MDYEREDKLALKRALIALGVCPKCRRPLRPAVNPEDGLACVTCDTVWDGPVMTKKLAKGIAAAKARTKAALLVGQLDAEQARYQVAKAAGHVCLCTGGLVAAPHCPLHGAGTPLPAPKAQPAPLTRIAFVAVRMAASGREYLDMFTLSNTVEGAQNGINERQRIDAIGLRKGTIDPYLRVAKIEIREIEEAS